MKKLPKASILISVFILLLLFAVPAGAAYTITEFCPDGYASGDGDEYFVLEGTGDLSEWSVTDGEGTVSFPGGFGRVVAARSAAAYYDVHGTYPDYEIIDSVSFVPEAVVSGKFQMANTEDSLTLLHRGAAVQSVSWPDEVARGAGRIHLYENGTWDSRVMKIGQTRLSPETYSADKVTLFVSPDCSYQVLTGVIADAKTSIDISMYEFTHPKLAYALSDALSRGVTVRILMEGGPVGGISDAEKGVLDYLGRAGAEVYVISGTSEYPARYRYLHTKYLVADSYVTAVLSENFKESGIPVTGQEGNRGWGAVIYDSEVAAYFSSVFSADISGKDISRRSTGSASFPTVLTSAAYTPVFEPVTVYNVEVTPVFAPDTSYLIPNVLAGAESSVVIQQAYITKYPDLDENPWLTLAVNAAKAGADVRVQLDAMYYNTQDDEDNDELAAELNRAGIPTLSARLLTDREGISKIHNKGMIVDGRYVLVSSVNWNYNSPNNNRESAVIIDSPEAAAYFTKVFDYDWDGYVLDNPASYSLGFDVRFLIGGIIIAGGIVFVIIRRR
ncbi:MAG TPA: phospholipase D-like domain-containing protein, partial [Methanocorpusculum sp.]|nr:phospholipase D-like domain-containing protein [Methanocorpusculum sp.]